MNRSAFWWSAEALVCLCALHFHCLPDSCSRSYMPWLLLLWEDSDNRSRCWVFLCRATVDHVKSVFASKGSDSWWSLPLKQLLPDHVIVQVAPYSFRLTVPHILGSCIIKNNALHLIHDIFLCWYTAVAIKAFHPQPYTPCPEKMRPTVFCA